MVRRDFVVMLLKENQNTNTHACQPPNYLFCSLFKDSWWERKKVPWWKGSWLWIESERGAGGRECDSSTSLERHTTSLLCGAAANPKPRRVLRHWRVPFTCIINNQTGANANSKYRELPTRLAEKCAMHYICARGAWGRPNDQANWLASAIMIIIWLCHAMPIHCQDCSDSITSFQYHAYHYCIPRGQDKNKRFIHHLWNLISRYIWFIKWLV